jgi:hypothetical protein
VSDAEMTTALQLFSEAVAAVAGDHGQILEAAISAGAINGVEEAV